MLAPHAVLRHWLAMKFSPRMRLLLGMPLWIAQLATGAKSFVDNPLIGSHRLNRLGLHGMRIRLAHAMAKRRRARLARALPAALRAEFDSNGFVAIADFLAAEDFAALRAAILDHQAPAREMQQGDAVTRRIAVDPDFLRAVPAMRGLLDQRLFRALQRYASSFAIEPLHYVQTILTHRADGAEDPQLALHADTFHPTMKAWLFLNDVGPDEGPFTYVAGSHRLTPERLAWERARSLTDAAQLDRLSARGSLRIEPDELASIGLAQPVSLAVAANTLVVADTCGFHARGRALHPVRRVEIWSYSRRNPFIPWLGLDPLSLRGLAERRIGWVWALHDRFAASWGQPWHKAGYKKPLDD